MTIDSHIAAAATFVEKLLDRRVPWAPRRSVLAALVTTSEPGSFAGVTVTGVKRLVPGGSPPAIDVELQGELPRLLRCGENVTVAVNQFAKYHGYQIKSAALRSRAVVDEVVERSGDELFVHGQRTFTTHHGPYTQRFFERVPHDEVLTGVGDVRQAILAIGQEANVSPRYIYCYEIRNGQLITFHGDGATMKTYRNLAANCAAVQVVADFEERSGPVGYALLGRCVEVPAADHPDIWREVCRGFKEVGFGVPTRLFRHAVERIAPLAATPPAGAAAARTRRAGCAHPPR